MGGLLSFRFTALLVCVLGGPWVLSACTTPPAAVEPALTPSQRMAFLDAHALSAPAALEKDPEKLTQYLLKPANNDAEKVRVITRWLADRFDYDVDAFLNGTVTTATVEQLLLDKKAACEGFSSTFEVLGKKAGLKVMTLAGLAKGPHSEFYSGADKPNHAWNAVRIDGVWKVVDATWAAGFVDGNRYAKRFDDYYILQAPEQLLLSHFSLEDELGTQRAHKVSKQLFLSLPRPSATFLHAGFPVLEALELGRAGKLSQYAQTYDHPYGSFSVSEAPLNYRVTIQNHRWRLKSEQYEAVALVQQGQFTGFNKTASGFELTAKPQSKAFQFRVDDFLLNPPLERVSSNF